MKKAILSIAIAIMGVTSVQASVICEPVAEMAKDVMRARQSGVALSDMKKIAEDMGPSSIGRMVQAMVAQAYNEPRDKTEKAKQKTITAFSQAHMLLCVAGTK